MQTILYADTERQIRGINHRVGTFLYKDLGEGHTGTPGNFNLRMVWSETDFFSPRHMHNFDQVRIQVQGQFHFDTDGTMVPGTVGYFPEGTAYGPQTSNESTVALVMQIGGASGNGYLSETERIAAVDRLVQQGVFRNGRYYRSLDGTGPGMDGFQAAWEQARGRRMRYPAPRFQKPMLCDPRVMAWDPVQDLPGVACRRIWDFGPHTVGLLQYQLAPGSRLPLAGPLSCFVEHGGSRMADVSTQVLAPSDVAHLDITEAVMLQAIEATQLLVFVHPRF